MQCDETPEADGRNPRKAANFIFACMIVAGITFFITGVTLVALAGQRDPFDSKTSAMRFTGLPMIVLAFPLIIMGTLMCFCCTATVPPPAFSTQPQPVISGAAPTGMAYPLST